MVSEAEVEAAALAIATHADGGNIAPGSTLLTPAECGQWKSMARAALEAAEVAAWRPISEADKTAVEDETAYYKTPRIVWLAWQQRGEWDTGLGFWHNGHVAWFRADCHEEPFFIEPTYWRSLPAPPKE